jgi:ABC-2 type transport system permease protein
MGALPWPLTFVSSAYLPPENMPGGLEAFAATQPISEAIDATRALLLDQPVGDHAWVTVIWFLGITLASATIATTLFKRKVS